MYATLANRIINSEFKPKRIDFEHLIGMPIYIRRTWFAGNSLYMTLTILEYRCLSFA